MAEAIRTKDLTLIDQGETTANVTRPLNPHPKTVYGTFRKHGRSHFVIGAALGQSVRISFRLFRDDGMLRDLERRSLVNASGKSQRGPAVAVNGKATFDFTGVPGLLRAAAEAKSHKAVDGPLVARVKLLEQPTSYDPKCRICRRIGAEHEFVTNAYTDWMGREQDAWWCVPQRDASGAPVEGACQLCAAAPGIMCDHSCPNRDQRGGNAP